MSATSADPELVSVLSGRHFRVRVCSFRGGTPPFGY